MFERFRSVLVSSFVGAIALGWVFAKPFCASRIFQCASCWLANKT